MILNNANVLGLCQEKVAHSSSEGCSGVQSQVTFMSLRLRLTNLLMQAIEVETNPVNTQMLLGGLFIKVKFSPLT